MKILKKKEVQMKFLRSLDKVRQVHLKVGKWSGQNENFKKERSTNRYYLHIFHHVHEWHHNVLSLTRTAPGSVGRVIM